MKEVAYTQVWGMSEWMEDHLDTIGHAFMALEQVQWLRTQGYTGQVARHYDAVSDNFHIKLSFNLPDELYTFLMLKWPDEVLRVDFNGPTIKEERIGYAL